MPINSLHTVTVVEQENFPLPLVDNHTAKESVQPGKESITFFLVKMNQPAGAVVLELVTVSDERHLHFWIHETLAREQEDNVLGFVKEGLVGGK